MEKKLKYKLLIIIFLLFSVIVFFLMFNKEKQENRTLFSWNNIEVKNGGSELFKIMKEIKLNTLYQEFSEDLKQEDIKKFLKEANTNKIEVCLLAGNPKWALDKTGNPMLNTIKRVNELNKSLNNKLKIKTIVFDIEPYQLEEWEAKDKGEILAGFVDGMKIAYKSANENKIKVVLCIPYFYDNIGLTRQLGDLIETGCDSVAVMNYYRDKEVKNLMQEVEFTHKYGKKLITIYELQAPGTHGLTEKNTYYNEGILKIEKNFDNIKREFPEKDISIAFHEFNSLKEMLGYE